MTKARAGIINVTGYAGVELARLLHRHPSGELRCEPDGLRPKRRPAHGYASPIRVSQCVASPLLW